MANNGGYYAIKGFEFQIDKSILEILEASDENESISIENIQDLDSEDFVMQIKYRETQEYTDIKIREPIVQLIEEFKINPLKKYKLYCHFNNRDEAVKVLDKKELNLILTLSTGISAKARKINEKINSFSDDLRSKYVENFELIFAPEHRTQLEKLLALISEKLNVDLDGAVFHHGNLSNYLRQKALADKACTKKELLNYIQSSRSLIFTSEFRKYKGDEEYFRYIKNKYFSTLNIDNFERFFVIELDGGESVSDIKKEILKIKDRFYIKRGISVIKIIKSGAPYIYFKNITAEKIKQLKTELLQEGHIFKDGHNFCDSDFCIESIKECSTITNNVCIKFINTEDNLQDLLKENLRKTKEIYQFYINSPIAFQQDIKNIKIHVKSLPDISSII